MAETFGEVLRSVREAHGLSLAALAGKVYSSKSFLAFVETGDRNPTAALATACDAVFGTAPLLTVLYQLDGQGDSMQRRTVIGGLFAGLNAGGLGLAVFSEQVRGGLLDMLDQDTDWDAVVADYTRRLAVDPSESYGTSLLGHLTVAQSQAREFGITPQRLQATSQLGLLYGLWLGNMGNIAGARGWYRTAVTVADRSEHKPTLAYALGRSAARSVYEDATVKETLATADRALALSSTAGRGALEAYSASAIAYALTRDLGRGRTALVGMQTVADSLPDADDVAGPRQRTMAVRTFFESRVAPFDDAARVFAEAEVALRQAPEWMVESRLYFARAMVAAGDVVGGVDYALTALHGTEPGELARILRVAVSDILSQVPARWRSDEVDELSRYAAAGPVPWEALV